MQEELPTLSKPVYPRLADPIGPSPGVPAGEIGGLDVARHHIRPLSKPLLQVIDPRNKVKS